MYTVPTTPEEQRYFSKHSIKRKVYGIAQFILQNAHIALALGAWTAIYLHALRSFPTIQWLVIPLALLSLGVLHLVYKTTSDAYFYDRLDNDPNTDSSPVIPLVILIILLVTEQHGASMLFKNAVQKADSKDDSHIVASTSAEVAEQKKLYSETVAEINAKYAPLLSAKSAKYDAEIAAWSRKATISDNDVAFKNRNVAQWKSKRADALAQLESAKAAEIAKAGDIKTANIQKITERKDHAITSVLAHNDKEQQRYSIETDQAGSMAWLVSSVLIILISALGYARVRINVKSGILPIRTFTELDQHGGLFELISLAIGDAFKRRATQYTTALHRKLSPSEPITTIDGTVITTPGDYNNVLGQSVSSSQNSSVANVPPVNKVEIAENDEIELRAAEDLLRYYVAIFNTAKNADEESETWVKIYDLRSKYCADGIISYVSNHTVVCVREIMNFSDMIKRYPFPPKTKTPEKEDITTLVAHTPPQPEYDVVYNAAPSAKLPNGFEYQPNGVVLFKQDMSLFKQQIDEHGRVIGLQYKGPKSDWTAIGYSQVKAYHTQAIKRSNETVSDAVSAALDKWEWAISIFEKNEAIQSDNIKPITA